MATLKTLMAKALVGLFAVVFVSSFVACDNERITDDFQTQTFTEVVKKDTPKDTITPKDPQLEFYIVPVHEVDKNQVVIADTVGEKTSNSYWISNGKAKLSLKEYDYITEIKYKELNVAHSNLGKVMSEPERQEINGDIKYVTRCSFPFEDGNMGFIDADAWQLIRKVDGKDHTFAYAKLSSFEVLSLNNVEKASTRGETYVVDSTYTEAKVKLHYIYEGVNVPAFDVILVDTCFRRFLANDEVERWDVENKNRKVLNSTTERCDFTKVAYKKSGAIDRLEKSIILQYNIWGIDEYEKLVHSFHFGAGVPDRITYSDTALERTEGAWKVYRRYLDYGALFSNPVEFGETIKTKYMGYSESTIYDDGDVKVEFPMIDMSIVEGNTTNNLIDGDEWYDKSKFNNVINVDYQGYPQTASESVILKKEKVRTSDEYWDEATAKKTISLWSIKTSIDYVIRKSDGSEDRTTYEMDFGWSLIPISFWEVYCENNSYYTGAVSANVDNSTNKTLNTKDGNAIWKWIENAHSLVAEVSVANGTQYDKWSGKTVNDIAIERNGNTYSFGHDDYELVDNGASLGEVTSSTEEDVYPYTHSINFGYKGVTAESKAEGKIHIAKTVIPDIPTFFGKLKNMTFIVVNNPDHTDYMYSALAHLEGGYVVPGTWNKSGEIEWHLEWQQQVSADNLNGAAYEHSTGKWVPVHAWDSPDMLQYDTKSGANADNQMYNTANEWSWDEGNKVNGHASVTTDRFSFSMEDGVVSVKDARHNVSLGSWTYKQ